MAITKVQPSEIAYKADSGIINTSDELDINGDVVSIDWNPTYYTPDSSIAEASDTDDLSAHLKGIDDALDTLQATQAEVHIEDISSQTDGATKTFTISAADTASMIVVLNGRILAPTTDFTIGSSTQFTLVAAHTAPQTDANLIIIYATNESGTTNVRPTVFTNTVLLQASGANYETINHAQGEQFLQTTCMFKPGSGTYSGQWINGESVLTIVYHDANNIRLYNDSGTDIAIGDAKITYHG